MQKKHIHSSLCVDLPQMATMTNEEITTAHEHPFLSCHRNEYSTICGILFALLHIPRSQTVWVTAEKRDHQHHHRHWTTIIGWHCGMIFHNLYVVWSACFHQSINQSIIEKGGKTQTEFFSFFYKNRCFIFFLFDHRCGDCVLMIDDWSRYVSNAPRPLALMAPLKISHFAVHIEHYCCFPLFVIATNNNQKALKSTLINHMTKLWCCWNRFAHHRRVCWSNRVGHSPCVLMMVCVNVVRFWPLSFSSHMLISSLIEHFFFRILNDGKQTNKTRTIESIPFFFFLSFHRFFSRTKKVILLWIYRKIHDFYIHHLIFNDDKWPESAPTHHLTSKCGDRFFFIALSDFFTSYEPSI
jgi:hypothetical protein